MNTKFESLPADKSSNSADNISRRNFLQGAAAFAFTSGYGLSAKKSEAYESNNEEIERKRIIEIINIYKKIIREFADEELIPEVSRLEKDYGDVFGFTGISKYISKIVDKHLNKLDELSHERGKSVQILILSLRFLKIDLVKANELIIGSVRAKIKELEIMRKYGYSKASEIERNIQAIVPNIKSFIQPKFDYLYRLINKAISKLEKTK